MPLYPPGGGTSVADDLTTAETDTAKRLAPDGAGGVEWGAGAGGEVLLATKTLLAADILDLDTPIVVLAGVAGKVYAPISAQVIYRYGGTAYVAADEIFFSVGSESVSTFQASILTQTEDYVWFATVYFGSNVAISGISGASIYVGAGGAAPTTGNGTLDIWVWYTVTDD